jgi:hypothetical protein
VFLRGRCIKIIREQDKWVCQRDCLGPRWFFIFRKISPYLSKANYMEIPNTHNLDKKAE